MCAPVLKSFRGRIFAPTANDEIGMEYAYIDEPTYVLPETSRDGGASGGWIVLAAALTAAAGIALRRRETHRS